MQFAKPEYLYLLISIPLCIAGWLFAERRRRRALNALSDPRLLAALTDSLDLGRRRAKVGLTLTALLLLIVAVARPQLGSQLELVEQRGLDIMVVLDVSNSMLARDLAPSRLDKAKLEVNDLLQRLPAASTGLVVFAGSSFIQFPLTTDAQAARMLLDAAKPEIISVQGTAIGDAIRRATGAFDPKTLKYKVILLLTDGEDHDSDPLSAAREAAEQGVVVYAVGFGRPEGEPIPVLDSKGKVIDYKKDRNGQTVLSRLDEAGLQEIARLTSGAYYRATQSGREIEQISAQIQTLEQREEEGQFLVQRVERFQIPLALGLLALVAEFVLSERRRKALTPGPSPNSGRGESATSPGPSPRIGRGGSATSPSPSPRIGRGVGVRALVLILLLTGLSGCAAAGNRQGNRLYSEQQYDQALLAYQAAQAELPEQPELHYNVGNTLHRMGDYAKAVTETLQVQPDAPAGLLPSTAYNLGNSLYRLEDYAIAVEAYKQALRLKPDDLDAKVNLELALLKLQEQQEQQEQQDQAATPTPQADQQSGESTPTPQAGSTPNATTTPSPQAGEQNAGTPTPQAGATATAQAGMTPQQAIQLLQALAQDEQTLQEILAQLETFPDQPIEKDW